MPGRELLNIFYKSDDNRWIGGDWELFDYPKQLFCWCCLMHTEHLYCYECSKFYCSGCCDIFTDGGFDEEPLIDISICYYCYPHFIESYQYQ